MGGHLRSVPEHFRIVIGDDAIAVRARLREALCAQVASVEVCEASDAQETIELIQSRWPMLAILDLSMPGGGGLAVLEWLQQSHVPCIPIVYTNHSHPAYRRRCQRAGVQFFFDKAYDMDELLSTVRLLMAFPGAPQSL